MTAWLGAGLADRAADEDRAFLPEDGTAADFDAVRGRTDPASARYDTATVVLTGRDPIRGTDVDDLREVAAGLRADPSLPVEAADDPVVAPDGRLAFVDLRLRSGDDPGPAVEAIRAAASERLAGAGREVMVTGGAAADADLGTGDVDLWLLLVSAAVVACILAVAYRSVLLWLLPVTVGIVAVVVSRGFTALLAMMGLGVTELAASIATVVVFGVSTDYALLLLNRLRTAAGTDRDRRRALASAVADVRTPVAVSAGIIALVVLTLVASPVPGMRALGPVLAVGVVTAATACLTLLPAVLAALPARRRARSGEAERRGGGRWVRVAGAVCRRPGAAVAVSGVLLAALALGGASWRSSADPLGQIPDDAESKRGAEALREHLGEAAEDPVEVILRGGEGNQRAVVTRADALGAELVGEEPGAGDDHVLLSFRLEPRPYTEEWSEDLARLEAAVLDVEPGAAIGGTAVEAVEREEAAVRQLWVVGPLLLLVLTAVLGIWLRSLVAAGVIVASSCLSCVAGWGALALLSPGLSGSRTVASEVLLFGFLFLVAFGVDYVVFLVDGIRRAPGRSLPARVSSGLAATGPVITAAGAILAATFATLVLLPEANVRQVGILVAVGVLIDTLVVRVLFVPAMLVIVGRRRGAGAGSAAVDRSRVSEGSFAR